MSAPARPRAGRRSAAGCFCLALALAGCEVITLEPDLDAGAVDGPAAPVLGDGWADAATVPEDAAADRALPAAASFVPTTLDFGDVEPYSTVQRSVQLVAGAVAVEIASVGVGGPGFDLDPASPRAPLILRPGEVVRWTVEFTPEVAGRRSAGELVVVAADGIRRVPLTGRGAWSGPPCAQWTVEVDPAPPRAIEPGAGLLLKAKPPATVALGDVGLLWSVVDAPAEQQPLERFADPEDPAAGGPPDDPRSFAAVLLADKPGRYAFRAVPILPPEARCEVAASSITVHACPCPDRPLHVRIGWQRSADAAPGRPRVAPFLISGAAETWEDGLREGRPSLEWGRPGRIDDPQLDILAGDTSGRVDIWLDTGHLQQLTRLALAILDTPDNPRSAVDITVDIAVGDKTLASLERRGVVTGHWLWDVAAIVADVEHTRLVAYDRLLRLDGAVLPPVDRPLPAGSPCDLQVGPPCEAPLACRSGRDAAHCRP